MTACKPPGKLAEVDGWHWLGHARADPKPYLWQKEGLWTKLDNGHSSRPEWSASMGFRYLAPVTPPDVVAGLVEALEGLEPHLDAIVCYASTMGEHEPNRLAAAARAALARAKGVGV